MTIRIAMWSGPRNISTAMMRSFGSRADCAVSDEPFYGAFLKSTGEPHPMAAEIIAGMDCDWDSILKTQTGAAPDGASIWYQKHMPHHMVGPVGIADMPDHRHAFLIRAPERVIASYQRKNELRRPEMLGFADVRRYFEHVQAATGVAPPVVDSDDIVADPEGVLKKLCRAFEMPWDPAMLSWEKGPHPEDGIWGEHWYDAVNASSGFNRSPISPLPELSGPFKDVADACQDDYQPLRQHCLI